MKFFFVIGVMVVCVLASHHSEESLENDEEPEQKPNHPVMHAEGSQTLKCMKNETTGCLPCGPEQACIEEMEMSPTSPCPKICELACICMDGYVREPDGNCILEEDCPDY